MRRIIEIWSFLLMLIFLFFVVSYSESLLYAELSKVPHKVPKVTGKVIMDGILDEKVWQEALVLELNYEVAPGENIKPPVKTEVLLAYGAKHLYVGFRAYDPRPSEIRSHVTDRDNITNDDYVGIVLDTFNDSRRAYSFYCNPYAVQADLITVMMFSEEKTSSIRSESEWDGIWNSAGKITQWGYIVEMRIPFTSLRFQKTKVNQVWGIDAVRSYPRSLLHLIGLFPRDRSNNCYMCQSDKVIGFKGAKPGLNIEFDPTVSSIVTQKRESFPDGKFVKKTGKVDPGLTARWSFTPNLTLSGAVNPDFSHVEADYAQLDINTQFILFYPEKRPFFLEGATIFRSRFNAVYTRSIVDPNWGIKVTGKEGKHAIGFFSVQDSVTNLVFPGSELSDNTSMDMNSIGTVLRYSRDIGRSSNLGIIITDREGKNYFNRVAGIDADLRFTKRDRFLFQFLGTQTRYPDHIALQFKQPEGKFMGGAIDCQYNHATEHFFIFTHYQNTSPNFRADLGFVGQTGTIAYEGGGDYTWRHNPGHWYTMLSIGTMFSYMIDHNKHLLHKMFYAFLNYEGPLQSFFNFQVHLGKRTYLGREFDKRKVELNAYVRPSGSLFLKVKGIFGDQVDLANIQAGKCIRIVPGIQYNLGRRFYLQMDHLFERLDVDAGRLYTANLSNFRLVYQFTRRIFLRTILQYANFHYNTELYSVPRDPKFKHLFTQILFSYKISPQTMLFLGYSDDYYGFNEISLKQKNRTFFLKIGYALVL